MTVVLCMGLLFAISLQVNGKVLDHSSLPKQPDYNHDGSEHGNFDDWRSIAKVAEDKKRKYYGVVSKNNYKDISTGFVKSKKKSSNSVSKNSHRLLPDYLPHVHEDDFVGSFHEPSTTPTHDDDLHVYHQLLSEKFPSGHEHSLNPMPSPTHLRPKHHHARAPRLHPVDDYDHSDVAQLPGLTFDDYLRDLAHRLAAYDDQLGSDSPFKGLNAEHSHGHASSHGQGLASTHSHGFSEEYPSRGSSSKGHAPRHSHYKTKEVDLIDENDETYFEFEIEDDSHPDHDWNDDLGQEYHDIDDHPLLAHTDDYGQDYIAMPGRGLPKPGLGLSKPGHVLSKPGHGLSKSGHGLSKSGLKHASEVSLQKLLHPLHPARMQLDGSDIYDDVDDEDVLIPGREYDEAPVPVRKPVKDLPLHKMLQPFHPAGMDLQTGHDYSEHDDFIIPEYDDLPVPGRKPFYPAHMDAHGYDEDGDALIPGRKYDKVHKAKHGAKAPLPDLLHPLHPALMRPHTGQDFIIDDDDDDDIPIPGREYDDFSPEVPLLDLLHPLHPAHLQLHDEGHMDHLLYHYSQPFHPLDHHAQPFIPRTRRPTARGRPVKSAYQPRKAEAAKTQGRRK